MPVYVGQTAQGESYIQVFRPALFLSPIPLAERLCSLIFSLRHIHSDQTVEQKGYIQVVMT